MVSEFHDQFDWRRLLRERRLLVQLTQPEVARRAGLSLSAVKAYEAGDRHPSRDALSAIIDAVGLPVEDANRVLAGAGYAIDMRRILHERYAPRSIEWCEEAVTPYEWPVFVTNQASDVLVANRMFRDVIGIPRNERLPAPQWNFIACASDPAFASRMVNWDRAMTFMIGLGKAETRWDVNAERPSPPTNEAYRRFLEGDPAYITRLLRLWEAAEPVAISTRMTYPVRWTHTTGEVLSFTAIMHVADLWQELTWHDWVPIDAATIEALAALNERRGS